MLLIRNVAVVGKRTTAVYAEHGRNPLLKCVAVAKLGQGWPRSKDCGGSLASAIPMLNMNVLARHRRTGTGKPKSQSRRFDLFCEGQGHICHL